MKQISSVDLIYLASEFKVLENNRVDSFYYDDGIFYVRVYVRGVGHRYLINKVSKYIYINDSKVDSSAPDSFVSFLRKYLKSSFIREIFLIPNERIIRISFEQKKEEKIERYYVYLELFAKGNIIVCDGDNVILNSLVKRKFKARNVMVRDVYKLPPKKDISFMDIDEMKLSDELGSSDLSLVKFLAINLGLGGKFSEEVCFRLGVNKDILCREFKDVKKLINSVNSILNSKEEPFVLRENNKIIDFFPIRFESVSNLERVNSFNDAIMGYFEQYTKQKDIWAEQLGTELKKLQNRLSKQEKLKEEVLRDYERYNLYGNKIYENYSLVEKLLESISKTGKEKGWEYAKEMINSDEKLKKVVSKLNYKNNEIVLDLD